MFYLIKKLFPEVPLNIMITLLDNNYTDKMDICCMHIFVLWIMLCRLVKYKKIKMKVMGFVSKNWKLNKVVKMCIFGFLLFTFSTISMLSLFFFVCFSHILGCEMYHFSDSNK